MALRFGWPTEAQRPERKRRTVKTQAHLVIAPRLDAGLDPQRDIRDGARVGVVCRLRDVGKGRRGEPAAGATATATTAQRPHGLNLPCSSEWKQISKTS